MASIQVQRQPGPIYRRVPWLAERTLRHDPAERLRRAIRSSRTNLLMNGFFGVLNVATGKAIFLVMVVPALVQAAHRWHTLHRDPAAFHEKDRTLRQLVEDYRAEAEAGAWHGIPPVPLRLLVAPAVAVSLIVVVWTLAHPSVAVSLSAGLAAGVLWGTAALLSLVLGIGSDDRSFAVT